MTLTPNTAATADDPYGYYARLAVEHPFFYRRRVALLGRVQCQSRRSRTRQRRIPRPAGRRADPIDHAANAARRALCAHGPHDRRSSARAASPVRRSAGERDERGRDRDGASRSRARSARQADVHVSLPAPLQRCSALLPRACPGSRSTHARWLARSRRVQPRTDVPRASSAVDALDGIFAERFPDVAQRLGAIGLLFQTYDGTAGLIGNTLYQLAVAQPEITRRIVSDPKTLAGFVAEVARLDPPVHNTRRFAASRHRDRGRARAQWRERAGATRRRELRWGSQGRTFTFGEGTHACIAARLAITIASVAVRALAETGIDFAQIVRIGFSPHLNVRVPRLTLGS